MRKSQYLDGYVEDTLARLSQNKLPVTPSTFLAYRLRGRAAKYFGSYVTSLINSLQRMGWRPGPSAGGSTAYAYYPPDEAARKEASQ